MQRSGTSPINARNPAFGKRKGIAKVSRRDLPIITSSNVLKTNIRQEGNNYIYEVDVPGYNKEDIKVNYEDGYLIVEVKSTKESKNSYSGDSYVRQERYSGSCSRSY